MCGVVPTPPEPKFNPPGWDFANAISSAIDLIGDEACTTATSGEMPTIAMPVNALVASSWMLR